MEIVQIVPPTRTRAMPADRWLPTIPATHTRALEKPPKEDGGSISFCRGDSERMESCRVSRAFTSENRCGEMPRERGRELSRRQPDFSKWAGNGLEPARIRYK